MWPLYIYIMDLPDLTVSNFMEKSIHLQRIEIDLAHFES